MGRSIHTTWREYERERRRRGGEPEGRRKRLAAMREDLARKRRIKEQVRAGRRRALTPLHAPPVPPEGVTVRVVDEAPHVVHAATEADLRGVIARLPRGALTGVREVLLCLGSGHQDLWGDAEEERDPHCGRVGCEIAPGVWSGTVLGVYEPQANRIQVFAYVVADELFEPAFTALYLKLRALSTFVHEVAHHQDHALRVARGRWRADATEHAERYAEALEHDWTREVVVPYLEEAYPDECAALHAWVQARTGVDVSLEQLAGDPRSTGKGGVTWITYPVSSAFRCLLEGLAEGKDGQALRLEFAEELHFGDHFGPAMEIVDGVLEESPGSQPARVLRADLLEHLGRYDEAEVLLRGILADDPACSEAWRVLGLVHWDRSSWEGVQEAASARLAIPDQPAWERDSCLADRARALLELGGLEALEADLDELSRSKARFRRGQAKGLRALSLLRQARYAEVLAVAESEPDAGAGATSAWRRELRIARSLALRSLGRSAELLDDEVLEWIRRRGYGSWLVGLGV